MNIGFIGAGTVGTALALRLREKGYPVTAVASRSRTSAQRLAERVEGCVAYDQPNEVARAAELVFVTTPDDAIAPVVAATSWSAQNSVVHCNGAASVDILEPAQRAGARVGAFHPLQSFSNVEAAIANLPGSTFALEAEEPLLTTLRELAEALEGKVVVLGPGDKVLYHAAAVIACNYFYTLAKLATDLWEQFGVARPEAVRALHPLIQGTVNNLVQVGLPQALTGPIARGDLGTIEKHLKALMARAPEMVPTYRELGLQTIPLALGKGRIDQTRAEEMRRLLEGGRFHD